MDPQATLEALLEACRAYASAGLVACDEHTEVILDHATALDAWLGRGGFAPQATAGDLSALRAAPDSPELARVIRALERAL